jgi:hypothetical protein
MSIQQETIPYTYLLTTPEKCLDCNKYQRYYGVRYAKSCQPDDFWSAYFTSSKKIKELIQIYGKESFSFEIRKIFTGNDAVDQSRNWESKVLKKLDVIHSNHWINEHDSITFSPKSCGHKNRKTSSERMIRLNQTRPYISYTCEKCNRIGRGAWFKNHHKINSIDRCENFKTLVGCLKCKTVLKIENWDNHYRNKCLCNNLKEITITTIKGSQEYRDVVSDSVKKYYLQNPFPEERKRKLSKKLKGRIFSDTHRRNICLSLQENIEKISKKWLLIFPDNETQTIQNLAAYL